MKLIASSPKKKSTNAKLIKNEKTKSKKIVSDVDDDEVETSLRYSPLSLKKGSRREVMLGRQEEIKPLGQPGQYVSFPSTSLLLPFFNDNELYYWSSV